MGIWKDIGLIFFDSFYMEEINVYYQLINDKIWDITFKIIFHGDDTVVKDLAAKFEDRDAPWRFQTIQIEFANFTDVEKKIDNFIQNYTCILDDNLSCNIKTKLKKKDISLWWPNGHGSQSLYTVIFRHYPMVFGDNDKKLTNNNSPQVIVKTIGFRTLELNQDLIDPDKKELGRYFYFIVNGRKIYSKGSNWIPVSLIKPHITDAYVDHLMRSVRDANMNMLRIWGGGTYESDYFFELADKYGIMIWQDAMFACALYPGDKDFLSNVEIEIIQQAQRLQSHPSVVIWSTNNENELGLTNGWYYTALDTKYYYDAYKDLSYTTIYENLKKVYNNPKRPADENVKEFPLVISSPSNGILETVSIDESIKPNPQNPLYGDMHFYNYYSDLWDWRVYPKSRFVSEYGFQSLPSYENFQNVTSHPETDLNIGGSFFTHRQHHTGGNMELVAQILKHFHLPDSFLDKTPLQLKSNYLLSTEFFRHFIYLSQIVQAEAMKTETEFYRRNREIDSKGQGYNMGALYWQLNDVWVAPTWSSIEYGGKWKMLHHFAKEFFAPVILTIHFEQTGKASLLLPPYLLVGEPKGRKEILDTPLIFKITNDLESVLDIFSRNQRDIINNNFLLDIKVFSLDNFEPVQHVQHEISQEMSQGSTIVFNQTMRQLVSNVSTNLNDTFISAQLINSDNVIAEQKLFLSYPKYWTAIPDPFIKIDDVSLDGTDFTIKIQSNSPAFYVWLEFSRVSTCLKYIAPLTFFDGINNAIPKAQVGILDDPIINIAGTFSENGFHLDHPNKTVTFQVLSGFRGLSGIPVSCFNVKSLYDTDKYFSMANKNDIISNHVM